jgi:hypothetical protein
MKGKRTVSAQDLVAVLQTILVTVEEIGGAKTSDKPLIDALEPAVNAGKKTAAMISKTGRSSYLGERVKVG